MMPAQVLSFDPDFASPAEWAAMYRALGINLVPAYYPHEARPGESWKRPCVKTWREFLLSRVPDVQHERWYGPGGEHVRRTQMGAITGLCSRNLFVLDLDTPKHPEAAIWWRELWSSHDVGEPETVHQRTGGGGRQLLFYAPEGVSVSTNKTSIGVDIRGQGGFAMLPASKHESGNEYTWAPGAAPWEREILLAPEWLLAGIEDLMMAHGGFRTGPRERTASGEEYDAFGHLIDDREAYMTRVVWASVVDWYRDCPIGPPPDAEQRERAEEAYQTYERAVASRLSGPDKSDLLEREGRGRTEFWRKFRAAIRQWDKKVAEAAAEPRPSSLAPVERPPEIDPNTGRPRPLIQTASEFIAGFKPPDYLIDGMVQRSYLYSLTARTGHGKTAVGMFIGQAVARGAEIKKRGVRQGSVLYLAGENPDDIRARFMVLADHYGFDPADIPIRFIAGVIDIEAELPRIHAEAAEIPDLVLVMVDTAAAYFKGDDGNSNVQQGAYARLLRQFTTLPGKPAVITMTHPVKNAAKDNLLPVGGGAFLNEVDGNLTLWANAEKQTTLHWLGKFRGPEFEPITFRLDTVTSDKVHDSDGQLIPSVVASPVSDIEMEIGEQKQAADEDVMLLAVADNPKASIARLATLCHMTSETGEPQKSKAFRILRRLAEDKLVELVRGKYRLTAKGKKEVGRDDE